MAEDLSGQIAAITGAASGIGLACARRLIAAGVSVARAFQYPPGTPLSFSEARRVIAGKLSDIHDSTANVQPPWQWNKQILHVLAYDDVARDSVLAALATIDAGVRGDTILYITITDGNDAFIY